MRESTAAASHDGAAAISNHSVEYLGEALALFAPLRRLMDWLYQSMRNNHR